MLWLLALLLAAMAAGQAFVLVRFQPLGLDFLPLWTAGRMAWADPGRVYDFAAVTHAQAWLLPGLKWLRPFAYPPTALVVLAPLGRLPFWAALALWCGLGAGVFLWASLALAARRPWLTAALAMLAPAAVVGLIAGQSALLVAGLAGVAMVQLAPRPRLAGALLAMAAAIKPQALLLAPLALAACGAWEALFAAGLTEAALVALSLVLFGPARWAEWLACLPRFQAVIAATPSLVAGLITPAALALALGLAGAAAELWRALFALAAVALVWRTFARPSTPALRLAALGVGGLMVSPYALVYDAALLVPAAAALAASAGEGRDGTWRVLGFVAACAAATPGIGPLAVLGFAALTAFEPRSARTAMPEPV
jgi:hypothetical protein